MASCTHSKSLFLWARVPAYVDRNFVSPRADKLKSWQIGLARWFDQHHEKGFWIGAAITEIWSTWNELFVYVVRNPRHTLDWHHWIAEFIRNEYWVLFYRWVMLPDNHSSGGSCSGPIT